MQSNKYQNANKQILQSNQTNIGMQSSKHWNKIKKYCNAIKQILECSQINIGMQSNKYWNTIIQLFELNLRNIWMEWYKLWNGMKQMFMEQTTGKAPHQGSPPDSQSWSRLPNKRQSAGEVEVRLQLTQNTWATYLCCSRIDYVGVDLVLWGAWKPVLVYLRRRQT